MSDFNPNPSVPPAPGATVPRPAPFAPPGAPPPPTGYAPPGYMPSANAAGQKPPRPAVPVGSALLILGGAMLIAGSFLNWFTVDGENFTGFSSAGSNDTKDGPVFVFLGVLAMGFGLAQLVARRVLAVAILAIVFAAFALLAAVADIGDVGNLLDFFDATGIDASRGPGLWIILVGSLVAVAGGIATVAKRRK